MSNEPTNDAVERAARAIIGAGMTGGGHIIAGPLAHHLARAALASAGAGAEVDREAAAAALYEDDPIPGLPTWASTEGKARWIRGRAYRRADAVLAARGDAATPTEVEWGVRSPASASGYVSYGSDEASARRVSARSSEYPLVQRTVSAWREVEGGGQS